MKVTREYIDENRSKGGWLTRPQMDILGAPNPLRAGWIGRSLGKELTEDQDRHFRSKLPLKVLRKIKPELYDEEGNKKPRSQESDLTD